jgi:glutathione S-transferase
MATEVHKRLFAQIFAPSSPDAAKAAAMAQLEPTLSAIAKRLGDRETLVGTKFTVADAYLVTLLNWCVFLKVDFAKFPTIQAYHQRHLKRPSVAQAMGVEMAERKRRAA